MEKRNIKEKRDESVRSIMEAATGVFADAGFAGARMEEIAKRAGVNKAMIYYRIGDKKALYTKVLHEVFGAAAERISKIIKDENTPEAKLIAYLRGLAGTMENHPSMPFIILREMASKGLQLNKVIANDLLSILSTVGEILDDGVKKGVFIPTDPLTMHLLVIGVMVLFRVTMPMRETFASLFPDNIKGPEMKSFDDFLQELEGIVLRAVRV
jgi:TetR/AcrR family transcriptional regulator